MLNTLNGNLCRVVYGSCAEGFTDITKPQSYEACVRFLNTHQEHIADGQDDPHYAVGLDIINAETGHLMSWKLSPQGQLPL